MRQEGREEGAGEVSRPPAEALRAEEMLGKKLYSHSLASGGHELLKQKCDWEFTRRSHLPPLEGCSP